MTRDSSGKFPNASHGLSLLPILEAKTGIPVTKAVHAEFAECRECVILWHPIALRICLMFRGRVARRKLHIGMAQPLHIGLCS